MKMVDLFKSGSENMIMYSIACRIVGSKRTIQNNECRTTTTCYFVQIGGQYNYAKYHNLIKFIAY